MKNKYKVLCLYIFLFLFFSNNIVNSEQSFVYEAQQIEILDEGNVIIGEDDVKIIIADNITITANKLEYNRSSQLVKLIGDIKLVDKINKITVDTDEISYLKSENKIFSNIRTNLVFNDNYFAETESFIFFPTQKKILSNDKVKIYDNLGNLFFINKFKYEIDKKKFSGLDTKFIDLEKNEYLISNTMINLDTNQIFGKDLKINFNKTSFGNLENDPRLKARSFTNKNGVTSINKGVFTTCKKTDSCPPWSLYAEQITHDNDKEMMSYKNAWLKIYDIPVVYFPKFSHPDPSVKRKSGFLTPSTRDSTNLGLSIDLPYFHAISENKDLTFKPRFYFNDEIILQNEYRQVNKNSDHIVDFSVNTNDYLSSNKMIKTHLFSNSKFETNLENFEKSNFEINFETVSNDTYLKTYKIDSPLVENESLLNSYFSFNAENEDLLFSTSLEIYNDLSKNKTDRYEFIYPNYKVEKYVGLNNENFQSLNFLSYGHQKKYATNIYEGLIINDILFEGNNNIFDWGLKNNFSAILKNVNKKGQNSALYKDKFDQSLLSALLIRNEFPLNKIVKNHESNLTPKISLMYSPNKTINNSQDDRRIDVGNVYDFNRLGYSDTIEGGASMTLGAEYSKSNKEIGNELVNFNLATVLRKNKNEDLPTSSTIGNTSSDIFGNLILNLNENVKFNYDFSLDNNLNETNYDSIKSQFSVNNFVTSFEYFDDKNKLNSRSYISSETNFSINKSSSIGFDIRKNRKTNATEYYDLFYNYTNDCLVASIKFNKEYYSDSDLKPEKQILLTLTIVPFGKVSNLNLASQ